MPFCQSCGSEHRSEARFCPACGTPIGDHAPSGPTMPGSPTGEETERPTGFAPIEQGAPDPFSAGSPLSTPAPPPLPPPPPSTRADAPATGEPRPLSGLTTALTVLFLVAAGASAIGAVLSLAAVGDATDIRDGSLSFFEQYERAENGSGKVDGASFLWLLTALPIFVLLVIWTHRAHRNLAAFGADRPRLPSGMAIGSWFIPLFFYLGPYWCIADAYKGAAPEASHDPEWRRGRSSGVVLAWWLTFCLTNVAFWIASAVASTEGQISFGSDSVIDYSDIVDDPDRFVVGWTLTAVAYVLSIGAAVLGALAVRAVGARQTERIGNRYM